MIWEGKPPEIRRHGFLMAYRAQETGMVFFTIGLGCVLTSQRWFNGAAVMTVLVGISHRERSG